MDFSKIEKDLIKTLDSIKDPSELESVRLSYLGKKGIITQQMKGLGSLSDSEKKLVGKNLNDLKNLIQEKISQKKIRMKKLIIRNGFYQKTFLFINISK